MCQKIHQLVQHRLSWNARLIVRGVSIESTICGGLREIPMLNGSTYPYWQSLSSAGADEVEMLG